MTLIWIIALLLAAFGGYLLRQGFKGKLLDDHPLCRRCGFDLYGKATGSTRCPECGADLNLATSTIVGHRKRRGGLIACGALLLLPFLALMGIPGVGGVADIQIDWMKYEPVWFLVRRARSSDATTRDGAIKELIARVQSGKITRDAQPAMVDEALRAQGDPMRAWSPFWAELIEVSRSLGAASNAQWQAYARQATSNWLVLRFRQRLRLSDPIPYRLEFNSARVWRADFQAYLQISNINIDGHDLFEKPLAFMGSAGISPGSGGYMGSDLEDPQKKLATLFPGHHKGYLTLNIRITEGTPPQLDFSKLQQLPRRPDTSIDPQAIEKWMAKRNEVLGDWAAGKGQPTLTTTTAKLPLEFDLVTASEPAVGTINNPIMLSSIEGSLSVSNARLLGNMLEMQVACNAPPVDLAFSVYARSGSNEWPIGELVCKEGGSLPWHAGLFHSQPTFEGISLDDAKIDVVFRPNQQAAAKSPDISAIWGQEVVLKDVAVHDPFGESRRQLARFRRQSDEARANRTAATQNSHGFVLVVEAIDESSKASATDHSQSTGKRLELLVYPDFPFHGRAKFGSDVLHVDGSLKKLVGKSQFSIDFEITDEQGVRVTADSPQTIELNTPRQLGTTGTTDWRVILKAPK